MLYRTDDYGATWTRVEGDFAPMDLDGQKIDATDREDVRGTPQVCFHNDDIAISVSRRSEPMPYWSRNSDGDELSQPARLA